MRVLGCEDNKLWDTKQLVPDKGKLMRHQRGRPSIDLARESGPFEFDRSSSSTGPVGRRPLWGTLKAYTHDGPWLKASWLAEKGVIDNGVGGSGWKWQIRPVRMNDLLLVCIYPLQPQLACVYWYIWFHPSSSYMVMLTINKMYFLSLKNICYCIANRWNP